jgi:hypothetical protein
MDAAKEQREFPFTAPNGLRIFAEIQD